MIELPEKMQRILDSMSEEWFETREMSRDSLREFMEWRVQRDLDHSPKVGEAAPDVELEMLTATGGRSGEMVSLSSYFGKPVALIFGSYT